MKSTIKLVSICIITFSVLSVAYAGNNKNEKKKEDKIKWITFNEAVKLSKKHPRKIFIDVYTDWCGWCKKMDQTTMSDPKIINYVNKKYYAVKLNAESNVKVQYNGMVITETELASQLGATGYPTTVYMDEKITLLSPVPGYIDVAMADKILHFYGEGTYKTQSWEQFNAVYKSE